MAERRAIKLGFTLVLLVFTILQSASTEDKCTSGCHGHTKTFKYVEGTTYNYNLDGSIDVTLSNAEGQQSSTKLKAQVSLTQLPQCNQLLKLHNVQIIGPDAKKYNNLADIEKPIRINLHEDGHVANSICTDPSDSQNALNIKRAVASMFQAATKQSYDTDVFGVCPTEITTSGDGANVIINKFRNLNKCAFRENIKQDFMATTFNLNSEIKSSPILNGEYTSEQKIKNGILDHAVVTEHYLYVPFSVGKNGAKATVSTKLHFTGTSKQNPPNKASVPKSIIFETPHLVNTEKSNADAILAALKEVQNSIDLTVGEKSAKSFVNLIKILRVSSKNDILAVYRQVRTGAGLKDAAGAKKIYLDAIFRAGTGDTIEASIELYKSKELGEVEQKLVYLSLAFVKHATPASLKAATVLLDNPNLPREGYLGVGILAGRYCREHSCKNNEAVNKLSQKLLSKLGDGKPKNRQQENVVISVLKAFANVDLLNDQALPKVLAIAQDKKVANRLRVAALETLLAEACKDKVRDTVLNILKDVQQDSEIRIKAYLLLAQCPNGKVASAIKTLFENEPSLQVGGFIASHLRSLKASSNPDKELAKQHLGQIITTKKFPIDLRKYSFNNEFSYSIDTLGFGSSTESNVIYSQNSFLPRSTHLNLTAELFGHTFNFLELGTRQENLEKVFEHYFGPVGVLGKATPEELLQSGKTSINKIFQHFQERLSKTRGKRDVSKSEIESIGKQVQIKTNELNNDLDLDLSVKLFGSELLFLSINDQDKKFTPDAIIDEIFDCLDGNIAKAKNFEKTIQSNVLFLDSEFSYPTSLGFPLKLSVEGSSTVQIKAAGSIDINALLKEPTDGSPFKLSLIPSANVEIEGSLTVDAQVVEGGLKVSSSLYTATGAEVEVVYSNNGQGLDVKFSLPVQKQKLISATHDVVFNVRQHGQSEVSKPIKFGQNKDFSICVDHLSPFIGLEFCADLNSPPVTGKHGVILPFPLSGNAKFAVGINREDLSHYHLKKLVFSDNNKVGAEFVLEAIGANNNQKLSLGVEAYLLPETYVKASILSPIITAFVEGRVTNNNQEKSISLQFQQDQQKYIGKVGFSVSGSPNRAVYKPLIEYNGPSQGKIPVQVQGQIIAEQNGNNVKYTFENVQVTGINGRAQPYSIQGNVGRDSGAVFADVTVSDGTQSGSLKGKLQAQQNQLKINAELKNTYNPHANFHIKYDYKRETHRIQSNLQLIHGADLSSKSNKLTINNDFSYVPHKNYIEIDTKNKLAYPGLNVDTSFDFASKQNQLKYDLEFQYLNFKVGSELDAKVHQKSRGDYDIEFEIYGNDNKVEIKVKREINGDKSKIHKSLAVNGNKFEVAGTVKHHCKPDDLNIGTDLDVKLPGRGDTLKFQSGLAYNPEELDSHLKIFSGSNVYVDVFLKGTKGGNANGSLKVNFVNILVADGQLRAANGVGTGNILVHVVRFDRKVKGEVTFTCTETVHNYAFTLYPNFEKDTTKLVLTTNNEVKENSFDSKNQIEVNDKKLEFNLKGQLDGKFNNGKLTGEAELILPNGIYYGYKVNRELYLVHGVGHGNIVVVLEQRPNKNAVGSKFTATGQLKSVDLNQRFIDVTYNFVIENAHGQIFNKDLIVKRVAQGDQIAVELYVKVTGTLFAHPAEFKSNALYKGLIGTYHVESTVGTDSSVLIDGKYDYDCEDHNVANEMNLELKTPSTTFSVVKFSTSGQATRTENQGTLKGEVGLFIDDNGSNPDATVDIRLGGEATVGQFNGQYKGVVVLQKQDPINVDVSYTITEENKAKKLNGQLNVQYNKDKFVKSVLEIVRPEEHEYKINLKVDTPQQPTTVLEVHTKRADDNQYLKNEVTFTTNNKKFVLTNELNLAKQTPGFNIKLVLPDGKVDAIAANIKYISEKDWESQFSLACGQTGFVWESNSEAHIVSIDEFTFKSYTNCPALKLDKLEIEAQNKPSKGAKNILVSVTSAGKNLVSGSTTYRARTEGDKYIVEGSGTYQVKEESKQGNFKFVRQTLSGAKHGEDGIEVSFNAGLGNQAVDSELKITNKQFRLVKSYCEEKQQCAHIEIDAKTINANAGEFNHEIEIAVDLRKLGLSHEFGLKGVTARKSFVLDHTVDVYFQSKENKYQYSVYVHPTEAGIQLTTPKRIVALESTIEVSQQRGVARPIKGEIAFYLDKKNQPNQKTSLSGIYHCEHPTPKSRNCEISTKFSNPALGKDLSVSYDFKFNFEQKTLDVNFVADIFQNPNHKIVAFAKSRTVKVGEAAYDVISNGQLKSEGLNIDITAEEGIHADATKKEFKYDWHLHCNVANKQRESRVTLQVNPSEAVFHLGAFGQELVVFDSKIQNTNDKYNVNTNVDVYGTTPLASVLEVTKYNSFKYTLNRRDNPNNKLQVESHFNFGKSAEFNADIIEGGKTHKLIHHQVLLDEQNFLKSSADVSSDNIKKYFLNNLQLDASTFVTKFKALLDTYIQETNAQREQVVQLFQQNLPNLQPIKEYYATELHTVRQEIVSDKTIEAIGEFFKGVFGVVINVSQDILVRVNEITEKVFANAKVQFARVTDIFNKQIIPRLTETAKKIIGIASTIVEQATVLVVQVLGRISEFVEAHQTEFKQLSNVLFSITHDVTKFVYKFLEQAQVVVNKEWKTIYEEFKNLPIAEELKDKYKQLTGGVSVPDTIINTVKQVFATIKDTVPSEDLKKIVTYLGDYIEKKLKGENVDDYAAIQKIVQSAVDFVNKLFKTISGKDFSVTDRTLPISWSFLYNLPKLVAIKFSPSAYIRNGEFPNLSEILTGVSFNPKHWVPPYTLDAFIAQGQHIFTFDGKHLTFPGNCNYLLARDAVNGNFSIVGTYENGFLTALVFSDKHDVVTIKKGGLIHLNNAAHELPIRKPQLDVYRHYETLNIRSTSGVKIICGEELLVCGVHVNGYYHGQIKGILGNANYEPYDDYTIPNGKIVKSESEFGNSYKLGNCPDVQTVDHHHAHAHAHNPACSKLFDHESQLSLCYKFVNPENFKIACDHGLAANIPDTEKAIVTAYVASCQTKFIPVHVPAQFVKCNNAEQQYSVGDTFSVKTPGKSADIVIVIDQIKSNEVVYKELVQPLISQIPTELAAKGVTDVKFHIILYGGEYQKYPSHYTVQGKLAFKGKSPAIKFTEEPADVPVDTGCPHLDQVIETLKQAYRDVSLIAGLNVQEVAYSEALKYPFRADAVKSVIAIVGKPCQVGSLLALQKVRALLFTNKQISLNLITPINNFVAKDSKHTKNIIGFDSRNVFTFSDIKKKPEGSSELHSELNYDDYCIDFTIKNNGNVFVTNNFIQAKAASRKQFVQSASHNIVNHMVNQEQGLDCECQMYSPYTAKNVCSVAYSKEKSVGKKSGHH